MEQQGIGKISRHAVAASSDEGAPDEGALPDDAAVVSAISDGQYKDAELLYRQIFKLATDVELNRERVLQTVGINRRTVHVDSDSDDERRPFVRLGTR